MLFDQLKNELLQARKNKDQFKIDLISYLIGECARLEKQPSDDVVVKKLKTYKTSVAQMTDEKTLKEVAFIDNFLPVVQEMSDEQIKSICEQLKANGTVAIKDVMVHFKHNYAGQYDGNKLRIIFQGI